MGFSTGEWQADTLVVTTTHIKQEWTDNRRNGVPQSDQVKLTEHYFRHGDVLTQVTYQDDPVYLSEPLVKTNGFRLALNGRIDPYPCESVVEVPREKGVVPNHLPGTNYAAEEFAAKHQIPVEAALGGAETALPEFAQKMKTMKVPAAAASAAGAGR